MSFPSLISRNTAAIGFLCVLLLAALLTLPGPLRGEPAAGVKAHSAQLKKIRDRLRDLQAEIRKDQARAGKQENRLRETEQAIGKLAREVAALDQRLVDNENRLAGLKGRYRSESRRMGELQRTLARHMRGAYAMSRQGTVKLLLNQEDPGTVSRVVTYARYLSEARVEGIGRAMKELAAIHELRDDIGRQTKELEALREQREKESQMLEQKKTARASALASLKKQIRRKGQEAARLEKDQARLQALIRKLQKEMADFPFAGDDSTPFAKRKGRLRWPVSGQLKTRYGHPLKAGNLKSRGVYISSPAGSEVRAVSHGRVVFADWLRGFGLLLIIDHGGRYMSLYGYNESLNYDVGDRVAAGDAIATVGASGGQDVPGLYFELRRGGRPINPMAWFKGLPARKKASG